MFLEEIPDCHGSKVPVLSDTQGMELSLQPLSPHVASPPLQVLGKGHAKAGPCVPDARP